MCVHIRAYDENEPPPRFNYIFYCASFCGFDEDPVALNSTIHRYEFTGTSEMLSFSWNCGCECVWRLFSEVFLLNVITLTTSLVISPTICPSKLCRKFSSRFSKWNEENLRNSITKSAQLPLFPWSQPSVSPSKQTTFAAEKKPTKERTWN